MLVIGLTGSIGMGKTTVASHFSSLHIQVCNADVIVHQVMGLGGEAVPSIAKAFPKVVHGGCIDRKALGAVVFSDKEQRHILESILHPLVIAKENQFITHARRRGAKMVVLDIPLLYETGGQKRCDCTLVVTAPCFIQKQRVLKRAGMTEEKFHSIIKAQMPDWQKRRRADYIINTGLGKAYSFKAVVQLVKELV